jgi:outer membrane scaffolding protein for murein synthesis (MipA/OmpV family)
VLEGRFTVDVGVAVAREFVGSGSYSLERVPGLVSRAGNEFVVLGLNAFLIFGHHF